MSSHSFRRAPLPRKLPLAADQAVVAKGKGTGQRSSVQCCSPVGATSGASACLSPAEARWRPRVPPLWKPRVLGSSLRGSGCGAAAGGGDRDAELPGAGGEDGGRQGPPALPAHRGGRQVSEWRVTGQGPPGLHRPGRDRGRGPASPSRPCSSRGLRRPAALSGGPRPGSQAYSLPRPVRHPQFALCQPPTFALLGILTSTWVPKLPKPLSC